MMDRDQRPSSPYRDEMRRQVDLADRGAFATQRCESHRFVTPVEMGKWATQVRMRTWMRWEGGRLGPLKFGLIS